MLATGATCCANGFVVTAVCLVTKVLALALVCFENGFGWDVRAWGLGAMGFGPGVVALLATAFNAKHCCGGFDGHCGGD